MSPDAIFVSEDGVTTFVNEAGIAMLRAHGPEEIVGRAAFDLVHPDCRDMLRKRLAMLQSEPGALPAYDDIMLARDGTAVPVEVRAVSYVSDGSLIVQASCRDISGRGQAGLPRGEQGYADALLDSIPGTFYHFDENLRLIRWNRNFEKVTGYSGVELASMSALDFHPDENKPLIAAKIAEVFAAGSAQVEADFLTKDGRRIPYLMTGVRFEHDGRLHLIGTGTDMAEHRIVEDRLRRERDYADAVIDSLPGVFYHYDEHGRLARWNRNFEHVTGYARHELMGSKPGTFFFDEERPLVESRVREVFETGSASIEATFRRKDGSGAPYLFTGTRFERDGKPGFVGVGTDISERKRIERELRDSVARFHAVARATGDAVWDWDIAHNGSWRNENYRVLFGTPSGPVDPIGAWVDRIHPEDRDRVMSGLHAIIDGTEDIWFDEYRLRRHDGGYADVFDRGYVLRDPAGRGVRMVGAIQDITERKRSQARLLAFNAELEQRVAHRTQDLQASNKELESFCYSVSHDLRAPLRGIAGFAGILARDHAAALDETGQAYLGRVLAAAERMGHLIDDLLSLSRVSRDEMRHETVNLSAMSREVFANLRGVDPKRTVEIAVEDGLAAEGDPRLLRIMFENLIGNAWKFTSRTPNARIAFTAGTDAEGVRGFTIADNGAGFDMRYADKLFAPFQRLHRATEFPGTGIGLATVQRIVSRHGGHISARSEAGKGASFHFTL